MRRPAAGPVAVATREPPSVFSEHSLELNGESHSIREEDGGVYVTSSGADGEEDTTRPMA